MLYLIPEVIPCNKNLNTSFSEQIKETRFTARIQILTALTLEGSVLGLQQYGGDL